MTRRREPAKGCCSPDDVNRLSPQTVVRFDRKTFAQIRAQAVSEQTSFSEQVRLLVEWGFEVAKSQGKAA
jgi:hypothetical protein